MKKFRYILYLLCILSIQTGFAQNVGISATSSFTPDASAGLDVSYTDKGLLVPRVALTATNAAGPITSPAISLLVYNTATAGTSPNNVVPGYYYWNGVAWTALGTGTPSANSAWYPTGNTGTTAGTNFIGTTDAVDFVVKTSGTERARVTSAGNLGIGSTAFNATNPEKLLVDAGASSFNAISGKGNLNNYLQLNIQNNNAGTNASSDVVATNDAGTEANGLNFIDMGVNSSGYSTANSNILNGTSNTYIYSSGNDMIIGNSTAAKSLILFTGGTAPSNERMRINGSGNIGIGTTAPSQKLDVNGSINASTSIISQGSVVADAATTNTGAVSPGILFGSPASGEGISSKRTTGTNQYGLDFYTSSTNRMSITNAGSVGIGTVVPVSTLEVSGSVGYSILVASTSTLTLGTSNYTVIIPTTLVTTITLPTASASTKRIYVIVNQYPSATTISSYISFTGSAVTSIPGQTSITVQSDGTNWYRVQ